VAIDILAAPKLFRTFDPYYGSIVRKRSGEKRQAEMVVSPFSVRNAIPGIFFAMAKKTLDIFWSGLGGIFVYRFVECCSNHGVIRTFEKTRRQTKISHRQNGYFRIVLQ
jgi:hypothetical protein